MEEKRYSSNQCCSRKYSRIWSLIGCFILIVVIATFFSISIELIIESLLPPTNTYVHIIRANNNTDINFNNLKRSVCMAPYFINYPFHMPVIGYELAMNSTPNLYSLDKLRQIPNITIYSQDNYDKMRFNKDIVVVLDYKDIPEFAQRLGCRECIVWNIDPTKNITDDNLFDITWTIQIGRYETLFLHRTPKINFYTISQDFDYSNLILRTVISENMSVTIPDGRSMSVDEILRYYECDFVANYSVKKW